MKEVIIIRYDEIGLKGANRPIFVEKLLENIGAATGVPQKYLSHNRGRIYLTNLHDPGVVQKLQRIFGISSFSPGVIVEKKYEAIREAAEMLIKGGATFKLEVTRIDKKFPLSSQEIKNKLGDDLRAAFPQLSVDVHNPDILLEIEVRDEGAVLSCERHGGPSGLPVGISGRALALVSGGIDSPVAAWYAMRRGLAVDFIYFHSAPYTGEKAKEKVVREAEVLSGWSSKPVQNYVVPFAAVQEMIRARCPEKLWTLLHRHFMHRIGERLARENKYSALITGDNLGQVASQTINNIAVIDHEIEIPILRPLVGFIKLEIIERAKEIGTFEISIWPYEDCCTLFAPKSPATNARIHELERALETLETDALIEGALANIIA